MHNIIIRHAKRAFCEVSGEQSTLVPSFLCHFFTKFHISALDFFDKISIINYWRILATDNNLAVAEVHKEVKNMNQYEVMYVIDATLEDSARVELIDRFSDLVKKNGGEIDRVDEWGKRRLAYAINYKTEGYYVLMYIKAPAELPKELERNFQINDKILRSLVIRYEGEVPAKREPLKPYAAREAAAPAAEEAVVVEAPAAVVVDDEKPESEAE